MRQIIEPPYEHWADLLNNNQTRAPILDARLGKELRDSLRKEVVAQANVYTASVLAAADEVGVDLISQQHTFKQTDVTPIIMSGHQPTLYHPGLLHKAHMLSQFTGDVSGIGVHVVIDTDVGDSGEIFWPKISGGALEIKRSSLVESSHETALYRDQDLASAQHLLALFEEITGDLCTSGLDVVAGRVKKVGALYVKLAERKATLAHTIVRWSLTPARFLEVPLSRLIALTALGQVVNNFVKDGERLASVYNSSLDDYRRERRIENKANPFPNVSITDEYIELPLWNINHEARKPVMIQRGVGAHSIDGEVTVPRGSITTMLLRAYCSDLFIHGLGGARYDNFVDRLAENYLGVQLPSFVVASETRYLFPEQAAATQRALELASQIKEMISRTESFLGRRIFGADEELVLQDIVARRNHLRTLMKGDLPADQKRATALALNEENRRVREVIEGGSLKELIHAAPRNEQALVRWKFREFPFFMFDGK